MNSHHEMTTAQLQHESSETRLW